MCKSASQAVLINSRMQLTLHATRPPPHGASRLVQATPAWSVKTRHTPSRHCRDARAYGHTTTAIHEIECISPIEYPPSLPRHTHMVASVYIYRRACCVSQPGTHRQSFICLKPSSRPIGSTQEVVSSAGPNTTTL